MSETGKNIIGRFATVYLLIVFMLIAVIYNIVKIQTVERSSWIALGAKNDKKDITVRAQRGNIYSANGKLMASSIPTYYLYQDLRVPALHNKNGKLFYDNIDSLAYSLSNYFKTKSKAQYKNELLRAYKRGDAEYRFYTGRVTYSQLKEIKSFPLFKLGRNKSGLITKEMFQRVKPYTSLASRTVGDIYAEEDKGGKNGLELGFDSILKGRPGVSARQKIANRWQEVVEVPPVDGDDITTTIDVDMQDIAEKALLDEIQEIEAESGYAILMETKTGDIKAIVNMQRNSDGTYSENKNGVVADQAEPGSVFKVMSLIAALDDGKAKLSDLIETGNGVWKVGNASMRDYNAHNGGFGTITLENAINASSNVGVSKMITRAYGNDPRKYVEKLYRMGLNKKFNLHIPGTSAPKIRYPNKTNWSKTTLAWMSIGYEVQIAPIYTVAYFNAIANNGVFIEPKMVKSISRNGQIIKTFDTRVINEQICKPSTLQDVRKAILGVVEDPKYATAKKVRSPYVKIGGKTGTALISQGKGGYKSGKPQYQVSFCGIFPFDNPQYTCLVVFRKPSSKYPAGGGSMAGPVVKNIAERVIAINAYNTVDTAPMDSTYLDNNAPDVKSGKYDPAKYVMGILNQSLTTKTESIWIKTINGSKSSQGLPLGVNSNKIPDLKGMGAKDAVYLCDKCGLSVSIIGYGKVDSQSLAAGSYYNKGEKIILNLN